MSNKTMESIKVTADKLVETIKMLIHEGNVNRIIIKNEKGDTYIEIPVTIGIISTILAPVMTAVAALASLAINFRIDIIRKE